LVNCPSCGYEVSNPLKTWSMPSRRSPKENQGAKLAAIFECPNCKARFRSAIEDRIRPQETANIKDIVGRIKTVKEGLMQTLMNLREKIETLEVERANLMTEIENLRRIAESKATALEDEVSTLREEVKSLKELLEPSDEKE